MEHVSSEICIILTKINPKYKNLANFNLRLNAVPIDSPNELQVRLCATELKFASTFASFVPAIAHWASRSRCSIPLDLQNTGHRPRQILGAKLGEYWALANELSTYKWPRRLGEVQNVAQILDFREIVVIISSGFLLLFVSNFRYSVSCFTVHPAYAEFCSEVHSNGLAYIVLDYN